MKKVTGILILFVFLAALYGRYGSYMYCRFESRLPDCDCEKILVTTDDGKIQFSDIVFSTKWEDQIATEIKNEFRPASIHSADFLRTNSDETVQGFPESCFHPPSIS